MGWEWEDRIWMNFEESSISLKQSLGGQGWRGEVGIDLEQEMFWKPLKAQLVLEVMHYLMWLICMTGGFLLSGVCAQQPDCVSQDSQSKGHGFIRLVSWWDRTKGKEAIGDHPSKSFLYQWDHFIFSLFFWVLFFKKCYLQHT